MRLSPVVLSLLLLTTRPAAAAPPEAEVQVGLSTWQKLMADLARLEAPPPRPAGWSILERSLEGRFAAGLLLARLRLTVETEGSVLVPLFDAAASLKSVQVDGGRAVALREGRYSAVLIDRPGRHEITVELAHGKEQANFTRAFHAAIPPAPVTRLELELPEPGLELFIDGGVVLSQRAAGGGTKVVAAFDGRSELHVRWQRRLAVEPTGAPPALALSALSLASLSEDLVKLDAELHFRVLSGEVDRVAVGVPPNLELVQVSGTAVLQWFGERAAGGQRRLVVLLKHLISDEVVVRVQAQAPRGEGSEERLQLLDPLGAEFRDSYLAIEGKDGFEVKVLGAQGAEEVGTRELPPGLAALSQKPILAAYRHARPDPEIRLSLRKNSQLELSQAVIDDLQASTVLVEQGLEVTKLRLYVRNNTRQYLGVGLPLGAELTHALIDGLPVYPAVTGAGAEERLLVPLRQSEKLSDARPRRHVVRNGETLGEIALRYFNRTDRWAEILVANGLSGPEDLQVGLALAIPASAGGVRLEESNFVLELAYKRAVPRLSRLGVHQVALPGLDIPVMSVTWHYYFPEAFEPLRFDTTLQQLTGVRYDPLRRVLHFLDSVGRIQWAWASDPGDYANILESRKAIYQKEQRSQQSEAFSAFPLVGKLYRFRRVLLGEQPAELRLTYVDRSWLPFLQWGALLLALLTGLRAARHLAQRTGWGALRGEPVLSFGAAMTLLLVLGHFVLGTYRHLLLGLDLALLLLLLPRLVAKLRAGLLFDWVSEVLLSRLWRLSWLLRLGVLGLGFGLLLSYPLLLSSFGFLVLGGILLVTKEKVRHA